MSSTTSWSLPAKNVACTPMRPSVVNLTAFSTSSFTSWRRRCASISSSGMSVIRTVSDTPFACASERKFSAMAEICATQSVGSLPEFWLFGSRCETDTRSSSMSLSSAE